MDDKRFIELGYKLYDPDDPDLYRAYIKQIGSLFLFFYLADNAVIISATYNTTNILYRTLEKPLTEKNIREYEKETLKLSFSYG